MKRWIAFAMCAACGHRAPPADRVDHVEAASAGLPRLEESGDRAYIADESGLVEVGPSGASQVLANAPVRWCAADARARVVWFVTEHGLSTFDLDDRQIHPIIRNDLAVYDAERIQIGELAAIVNWGKERVGGEDALAFDVGVSIAMTAHPQLSMEMGCDGDRYVYCFDENEKPSPSVTKLQAHVKDLALADPGYVARLAERGARRSLWSPTPAASPSPTPPAVDPSRCTEIREQCGSMTPVPSHALWLVVTDNSRGDYFHQTRELWDSGSGEFVQLLDGTLVRSKQPLAQQFSTDYGGLRVSPSGLSIDGTVFDAKHVIYRARGSGTTCGWASGGWRISGPTE